jgi:hypothetical protein
MTEGYIYCLTNETMPALVKIGEIHTEGRTPDDRARELYTTGIGMPFNIEFAKKVKNPARAESRIHAFLSDKRLSSSREFFKTTAEFVRKLFDLIFQKMDQLDDRYILVQIYLDHPIDWQSKSYHWQEAWLLSVSFDRVCCTHVLLLL